MSLTESLTLLTLNDPTWFLFVNPTNLDDFKILPGDADVEGLVKTINTVEISFGLQDKTEILRHFLKGGYSFKGKYSHCNIDAMVELFCNHPDKLDRKFKLFLKEHIRTISGYWSTVDAAYFVDITLPEIVKEQSNAPGYKVSTIGASSPLFVVYDCDSM